MLAVAGNDLRQSLLPPRLLKIGNGSDDSGTTDPETSPREYYIGHSATGSGSGSGSPETVVDPNKELDLGSKDGVGTDNQWNYSEVLRWTFATSPAILMGWAYGALTNSKLTDLGWPKEVALTCSAFSGIVNAGLYEIVVFKLLGGKVDRILGDEYESLPGEVNSQTSVSLMKQATAYLVYFIFSLIPSLPVFSAVYNIRNSVGLTNQGFGEFVVYTTFLLRAVATAQSLPQLPGIVIGLLNKFRALCSYTQNQSSGLVINTQPEGQEGQRGLVNCHANYKEWLVGSFVACAVTYSLAEHSSISKALTDVGLKLHGAEGLATKLLFESVGVIVLLPFNIEWSRSGVDSVLNHFTYSTLIIVLICILTGAPAVSLTDSAKDDPDSTQLEFETRPPMSIFILIASYLTGVSMNIGSLCRNLNIGGSDTHCTGGIAYFFQASSESLTRIASNLSTPQGASQSPFFAVRKETSGEEGTSPSDHSNYSIV
ncbi:MAG: hypothetical protein CL816_05325 [Coxiellaceae bacterium]|nr:hypothetical protein [Coxiellaceae bacterium]|tara:strand:+ start:12601 stop:14055 length:1455 start_codon:yes stop_codon:yes gene_type:complete